MENDAAIGEKAENSLAPRAMGCILRLGWPRKKFWTTNKMDDQRTNCP
jgi:hypothetical protein